MKTDITPQQLMAVNLKYGTTAKSLKALAFSDLSAKAIFHSNRALSIKEVAKKVAELTGISAVSEDLIKNGLEELKTDRKVFLIGGKWDLNSNARLKITEEVASSVNAFNGILTKHFPKNIDGGKLAVWFTDAIADFFIYNGDEWVQSVCKGTQHPSKNIKTADELLDSSIKKHGLSKYSTELKNSFRGFLASADIEDQRHLTNVGFAMFSARLVAADVGADPIALGELRNATFLVDTNFLFALQLEGHRFAMSLEALGRALNSIGAKLVCLNETSEEYGRVWTGKRAEIMRLLEVYPNEVVTDADDSFISTAVARGCSDTESFDTFFNSIHSPPPQMPEGPNIKILEDEKIIKEVQKAKNDDGLKNTIQRWCLKLRPFWNKQPKSKSALGHDAALIYVSEFERSCGNKVFILTLDRSLQACCAERVGSHDIPPAIYLEGLIHILAANNAGPELDATNFAPLLTSILLKRCVPPEYMYSPQDLHWLYGIQKNVAGFNPEKIKQIALEVTKARLAGRTADNDKLQRTINRLYQEEIQNTDRFIEESISRAKKAEAEAAHERTKRIELERKLKEKEAIETLRAAKWKLAKTLLWRIPFLLLLAGLAFVAVSLVLSAIGKEGILDFVIALGTLITAGYKFLKVPVREYFRFRSSLK